MRSNLTMKEKLKNSLLGSAGIYTLTQILNASIPFLLLPIVTRYLSPEEYGIYSMFKIVAGLVFSFIGLGLNGAITTLYFERKKPALAQYIFNSFLLVTLSSISIFSIFYIFPVFFEGVSGIPIEWLWTVIIASYGKVIFQATLTIWQVEREPFKYGAFQISQSILNFVLSLVLMIGLSLNWKGIIIAETFAFMLFGVVGLLYLKKKNWLSLKFDKSDIKHALNFGLPIIPHVIGMYIITASDRFLITNMVGVAETGMYAVGYQIAMVIMVLQDSFNKAWVPWLFEKLNKNSHVLKIKIVKFTYVYHVVITIVALLLWVSSPMIMQIFIGPEYKEAEKFILWLALGYAFNGMYKMVTNYIFYVSKTYYLAIVTAVTAVINIVLGYALIKINGSIGAAQATAISYFISFILTWFVANKVYKMPWFSFKLDEMKGR